MGRRAFTSATKKESPRERARNRRLQRKQALVLQECSRYPTVRLIDDSFHVQPAQACSLNHDIAVVNPTHNLLSPAGLSRQSPGPTDRQSLPTDSLIRQAATTLPSAVLTAAVAAASPVQLPVQPVYCPTPYDSSNAHQTTSPSTSRRIEIGDGMRQPTGLADTNPTCNSPPIRQEAHLEVGRPRTDFSMSTRELTRLRVQKYRNRLHRLGIPAIIPTNDPSFSVIRNCQGQSIPGPSLSTPRSRANPQADPENARALEGIADDVEDTRDNSGSLRPYRDAYDQVFRIFFSSICALIMGHTLIELLTTGSRELEVDEPEHTHTLQEAVQYLQHSLPPLPTIFGERGSYNPSNFFREWETFLSNSPTQPLSFRKSQADLTPSNLSISRQWDIDSVWFGAKGLQAIRPPNDFKLSFLPSSALNLSTDQVIQPHRLDLAKTRYILIGTFNTQSVRFSAFLFFPHAARDSTSTTRNALSLERQKDLYDHIIIPAAFEAISDPSRQEIPQTYDIAYAKSRSFQEKPGNNRWKPDDSRPKISRSSGTWWLKKQTYYGFQRSGEKCFLLCNIGTYQYKAKRTQASNPGHPDERKPGIIRAKAYNCNKELFSVIFSNYNLFGSGFLPLLALNEEIINNLLSANQGRHQAPTSRLQRSSLVKAWEANKRHLRAISNTKALASYGVRREMTFRLDAILTMWNRGVFPAQPEPSYRTTVPTQDINELMFTQAARLVLPLDHLFQEAALNSTLYIPRNPFQRGLLSQMNVQRLTASKVTIELSLRQLLQQARSEFDQGHRQRADELVENIVPLATEEVARAYHQHMLSKLQLYWERLRTRVGYNVLPRLRRLQQGQEESVIQVGRIVTAQTLLEIYDEAWTTYMRTQPTTESEQMPTELPCWMATRKCLPPEDSWSNFVFQRLFNCPSRARWDRLYFLELYRRFKAFWEMIQDYAGSFDDRFRRIIGNFIMVTFNSDPTKEVGTNRGSGTWFEHRAAFFQIQYWAPYFSPPKSALNCSWGSVDDYQHRHPDIPPATTSSAINAIEFQHRSNTFNQLWLRVVSHPDQLHDAKTRERNRVCQEAIQCLLDLVGPQWSYQGDLAYVLPWNFSDQKVESGGYKDPFCVPILTTSARFSTNPCQPTILLPSRHNVIVLVDAIESLPRLNQKVLRRVQWIREVLHNNDQHHRALPAAERQIARDNGKKHSERSKHNNIPKITHTRHIHTGSFTTASIRFSVLLFFPRTAAGKKTSASSSSLSLDRQRDLYDDIIIPAAYESLPDHARQEIPGSYDLIYAKSRSYQEKPGMGRWRAEDESRAFHLSYHIPSNQCQTQLL
ncbi:hypothetical protein BKA56DRAFT_626373 [Ilyonectria sp. MPI-CAGE-AT-0026]|nr:hypothetical protein BKA56DRAFT_626373 [Ilyonectria sp. MPI-CAGE-AT-0026]